MEKVNEFANSYYTGIDTISNNWGKIAKTISVVLHITLAVQSVSEMPEPNR